jgi:rfaE bifunctional protein nucleotidyltransferase chain/domain/rfaE bifunctional protein kinase chain/domain
MEPGTDLAALMGRFAGVRVVVVGDVMLDEWRFVEPERLAREAPAPVVTLRERRDAAGGAANTAVNLARLGAHPVLVAPVGTDDAGSRLCRCLADTDVEDRTVPVYGYTTPVKRRLLAGEQIVVREDEGTGATRPGPDTAGQVLAALRSTLRSPALPSLVICDYGLGALSGPVRAWLTGHRDRFATVALDAHDLRPWRGLSPTLVTPSFTEAVRALDEPARPHGADRVSAALAVVADLVEVTGADTVAVTLDADGAVVADRSGHTHRTTTDTVPASHTVGAGDVFLAALTLALSAGASTRVGAEFAQRAASVSVSRVGTCVLDPRALAARPGRGTQGPGAKVVDAATLARRVGELRRHGCRVVFTNGCFDVLHRGHVGYLEEGGRLGEVLVVAVNGDESVRRLKGPDRPVNRAGDRAAVLAALSCVDFVVVFDQDSPSELIEAVRPEVYVKGGDYPPELVPEAPLVRRLGGEVRILGYVPDRSTSAIIERIRGRAAPAVAPDPGVGDR